MGTLNGPVPKGWKAWGVDLSAYNALTSAHWNFLRDNGCSFVMLRACKADQPDARFAHHVIDAQARGMGVACYLLLRPEGETPIARQVAVFRSQWESLTDKPFRLAVDIEGDWTERDQPVTCVRRALWLIARAGGGRAMIYTYPWFWKRWLAKSPVLRLFPLWGALFPSTPRRGEFSFATHPEAAFGRKVAMWQFGGGPVDGVDGSPVISRNVLE